jgi:filamentous hemagglutinin family protein
MGKRRIYHILLASSALSCATFLAPAQTHAGPTDGTVTSGAASITQSGLNTNIHQFSDRAIIDWRSFDVNANESVRFYQPGSSSITLNRINDSKASQINGRIEANGQIMLLNQNGIVFGAGSRVDVAGLMAATNQIDDAAFMSGATTLMLAPGSNSTAKIINDGHITARDAGLVGLVAPTVENNGVIEARLGKVTLAGTDRVTLDLAGDGLISIDVDNEFNGKVVNTGTITADGGTIVLTASRARNSVENSIVNTGTLRANAVSNRNGRIILSAGGSAPSKPARGQSTVAAVKNAGSIQAASGKIEITGDSIELAPTSMIDASALDGGDGGIINIGGAYQGGSSLVTSQWVEVARGSTTRSNGDANGNGGTIIFWADRLMTYRGNVEAEGGDESGDGGFVEISGKNHLIFDGTVSTQSIHGKDGILLLDPTNITISAGADQNVSGTSPYAPTFDDATSVLNLTTLQNALALGNVIVQTRATGSQAGDITVSSAIAWTSGTTLTLDAHNNIVINQTISAGSGNLTLIAGNDVQINNNLSGTGNLTLMPGSDGITVGVGASAVGTFNITTAEFARLINGWNNITLGRTTATAAMDLRATTWVDNLTLQSGSGTITVNGIQNMGANTLSIITDGDINLALANALTGTGALFVSQASAGTTMGLGDSQAGTINFTNAEIARIKDGWASLSFGRTDGTGAINVGAVSFTDILTIQSGSGAINLNGILNMAANGLTLRTDSDISIAVANGLTGTGALTIVQTSAATSIGLGDSQTGTLNLTTAEVGRIKDGWASITIGRTDGSAAMNVGALSWTDALILQSGNGVININGAQAMAANSFTMRTDASPTLSSNITGTGTFLLTQSSVGTSMGIGSGETGTIQVDTVGLGKIMSTWASVVFGRTDGTGAMNVAGGLTMLDPMTFRTGDGQLNINGAMTMGANNLTLQTNSDLLIGGNLSGTNVNITITVSNAATSMGIGTGQAGTLNLSDTEVSRIVNGWAGIFFGSTTMTGAMNVSSKSWVDPLTLRTSSGQITVAGANMAANNLTISTDADLVFNGAITGTGTLSIAPSTASTTMGIGSGQTGALSLNDTDLSQITNGWANIYLGATTMTGAMNIGAASWNDNVLFRIHTGIMTVNGAQNMSSNNLTINANSNVVINAALTGTGTLSFSGASSATSIGIGTGQAGTLSLNDTELNFITDGWSSLIFGTTSISGAINIGARTWTDSLDLRTASGAMNINGAQNLGANNLIIRTNTNLALGQTLAGTGNITILGSSAATTMGIGDSQTGTLNLTNAELAFISDGWANILFGSTSMTGIMNVGARTWTDSVGYRTSTGALNINGAQNMGANNLILQSNADPTISGALTGNGTLTISTSSAGTTLGVGTGSTGTLALSDAELALITDGWSNIIIGATTQTGAMNVSAQTWNDNLTLITGTGLMTIAGNQTMGANNLTLQTDSALAINGNLTGTGQLVIQPSAAATSVGVGSAAAGTLALADAELARIIDGWAGVTIGSTAGTGALTVAARTWTDALTLRSGTGLMTIAGNQTMGANNLTLQTDSALALNANLVGTGNLIIQGNSLATTIGVGDTQTGTLALANAELARIVDGWTNVTIGRSDSFGAVNIGAYTWVNPMTFISGGNIIINGVQDTTETSGTNMVFATINGAFINNAGASAINPGTGRYLVYSVAEANDTIGGLTRPTILTNKTYYGYGPALVSETGNVFLYSGVVAKILYLTINNATKEYGSSIPTLSYTYVGGLQNSDTINDAITAYTLTAIGATVLDDAGVTRSIGGSFTTALGYTVSVTNGTLTVTKADLLVEADDQARSYGDINPSFTLTYTGFKNGDDETDLDTAPTATTSATALSNVGSYLITASGGLDNNYNLIYSNGSLNINKATLTATVQSATKVYGDANPGFNIVYSGFKNGETTAIIDTLGSVSTSATAASNVGTYTLTGSGAIDDNYSFAYSNSNLSITKAVLTATADDQLRIYGNSNPAFSVSYAGFKNGDSAAVIDTAATATTAATVLSNTGNYAITAAGAADNNYSFSYVNGSLTINKATLTATADNKTSIYGDANPALTVTYTGFKNGDTAGVIDSAATATTPATILSDVGSYAITAAGAADNNYDFVYAGGSLTINKATLTATADNKTRIYGDVNPALTVTYTGFKNGENSSVLDTAASASTGATVLSNTGSYAITASGAADNNYDFTYTGGSLSVTKAMLSATADDKTRIYGNANPALTTSYTGFKNGDTVSVLNTQATASTVATTASDVGLYTIASSGASDNNYDFTYVDGALDITKAMLTATADNKSRVYGDANPAFSVTYTGFKNGQNASVIDSTATASTSATVLSNTGTYTIAAAGGSDNNYDFSYVDGTLTITKATLLATADNKTRIYGDANPALTVSYTGFKNGEDESVLTTAATATTGATLASNVGSYTIAASGATDNNYTITYAAGSLSVTKAMLTATADNKTRIYGNSNPTLTTSYTGFKNGDTVSSINTQATATTSATTGSDVGTYTITTAGAADNNYDFTYVDGALDITKALLTVTADNKTRVYGDSNPALSVTYTGFKNGQNASVIDTDATATTGATILSDTGSYAITAGGAADNNYDFTYVNGQLTITKAMLIATADSASRIYGDANPALGVSYTGFKNGDTDSDINTHAIASTGATILSNTGNYTVTAAGAADNNYNFTYVAGNLAITKALLTVTADDKTRVYGNSNPALTVSYSGFKNGDTVSALNTHASTSTVATAVSDVGTYTISATGAADNNYSFAYVDGSLDITKANLTITADHKSRTYGDSNPALTMSYSGFKNGDNAADLDAGPGIATSATILSDAGTYAINLNGGIDNNYAYILHDGTLSINKALLTVTADHQTRIYGDANPALTLTYSGFKNGDTQVVIDTGATLSTPASVLSNVGNYAINGSGAVDNNYTFAYVNGSLSITPAALTVTINNATREYGLNNPTFTATYSGFKNGDTVSDINSGPHFTSAAGNGANVGTYIITGSGSDNNYSLNFINGNMTVTKAALVLRADNQIRLYGDPNPPLTYSAIGLRAGDHSNVVTGATLSTTATPTSVLGSYAITVTGGTAVNYTLSYAPGVLDIVGEMPPPPVTTLPPTATQTMNSPATYFASAQASLYGVPMPSTFLSSLSAPGQELSDGTAFSENGYVTIYYQRDGYAGLSLTDPLIMIEPGLYFREDEIYRRKNLSIRY